MQRSASALYTAGNTIDESIALITAANSVIQNPEQVGTALKTLSLRLRGAKTELEEAGLETDSMAESTSTLQAKLMALTHGKVDIMIDTDTFKSTTQILREMSEAWEDMTDIERAAALELMGGKRQANILSSVITNFETVEDVIETSMNSSGSAMEENEKWLDSIEGKTYQFTNALETMWMNMINADAIKSFVDFGTDIIKFLDTVPGKITAVVAALAGFAKFKGFSLMGLGQDAIKNINNIRVAYSTLGKLQGMIPVNTLDAGGINAYAAAVSSLTAKQQANMLASIGLSKAQIQLAMQHNNISDAAIREATAHVITKTSVDQETASESALFAVKAQSEAASIRAAASKMSEANATELNVAADILESATSKEVLKAKLAEAVSSGQITAATAREIAVKMGLISVNAGLLGSIKALFLSNPLGWIMTAVTVIPLLASAFKSPIEKAKELKNEVEDLKTSYKSAQKTFDDNLEILTTPGDKNLHATLESEFTSLAAGVDRYGNNISLTSDQYERYKEICGQIVGINPKIAQGYDSATKAIGNNVSVLSELIELQKIQARQNVDTIISDENFGKFIDDTNNDYEEAARKHGETVSNQYHKTLRKVLIDAFEDDVAKTNKNYSLNDKTLSDDYMNYVLQQLGKEDAASIVETYYSHAMQDYDFFRFMLDYSDEIKANADKFGEEYGLIIEDTLTDIEGVILDSENKLGQYQDELIDEFLLVPFGTKAGEAYSGLNDASKNFVVDWIKNADIFKLDVNKTEEQAIANRDKIVDMINKLSDPNFKVEYNGEQITAQDLLDQMYNFDMSAVNWYDYQKQINEMVNIVWKEIGGAKNNFGIKSIEGLSNIFGFDFVSDAFDIGQAKRQILGHIKVTKDELQNMLDNMSAMQVKAFYSIDWNAVNWDEIKGINDIMNLVNNSMKSFDNQSVKTYSALVSSIESFNSVQEQTNEVLHDGIAVTQEYKDALAELGISSEDLAECFDDANPLIVKNANGLKKLVEQTKNNTVQNIRLAKSQARLEYYDLYKEMKQYTNGAKVIDAVTLDYIDSLYEQMDVLSQTISKYSMLEMELLGAANAYQQLEAAQAADEVADYGSKAEELVNVLGAAFHTGELGTQAARVAIEGLIPDGVIDKAATLDEQMQSIYEYFTTGTVSDLFTIEFDDEGAIESVEMTKENIKSFAEKLMGDGEDSIFQGDWDSFILNPAIQSLDDFVAACKDAGIEITDEVAFAFLTGLEKYDIGNALGGGSGIIDQLMGDNLDYQLQKAIQKAAEVEKKLAEGSLKSTDNEYIEAQKNLEAREEQTIRDVSAWQQKQQALKEQKDLLIKYREEYEKALDAGEDTSNIEDNIATASEEIDNLIADLRQLGEPTEFVLEIATNEAQENIANLKKDIDDYIETLNASESGKASAKALQEMIFEIDTRGFEGIEDMGFKKDADGVWRGNSNMKLWTEIDGPGKEMVRDYISMIEEQYYIDLAMGEDTPTIEESLQTIAGILQDIATLLDPSYKITLLTDDAESRVATFKENLDGIKDKTVTVFTNFVGAAKDFLTRTPKDDGTVGVNGTAHAFGVANAHGSWGAPKTEESLVGELGPEMLVRNGRWTTVGDSGAEFAQVRKGDIIFNHQQTEDLLSKGHITSRGKLNGGAFASGSAYAFTMGATSKENEILKNAFREQTKMQVRDAGGNFTQAVQIINQNFGTAAGGGKQQYGEIIDTFEDKDLTSDYKNSKKKEKDSKSSGGSGDGGGSSDAEEEAKEIFDWIEVRLEEINEDLDLKSARLENAVGAVEQNSIIEEMIDINEDLRDNLLAGANEYYRYAETLLAKVPEEYRKAAQDGSIAIEEFVGETDEKTLEAIQEYRDWVQKGADATQQAEEVLAEIQSLAKQAFDNIVTEFENKLSLNDSKIDRFESENSLLETDKGFESENIYQAMIDENESKLKILEQQAAAMQAELDTGKIKKGTDAWYEAVNAIAEVDTEIINLKTEVEDLQDSINKLHWEKFEILMKQFEAINDEAENLIDILGQDDVVDELGNWTDKGITSLGLLAQQMEVAEMQAQQYKEEIEYLNKNWEKLGYTQEEYVDKLDELKSGQYDSIKAYHDAKDAISDLNKERVEAIKDGIEKEIEAYEELINKKKEALDTDKDAHDWQKSVAKQQKNISDIERQIAALSADNSISARAKRAQLEAELLEAKAEMDEMYYDRTVEKQKEALDKELESFQETKEDEIEDWEKYLENVELVVSDTIAMVQENTQTVLETLTILGQEFGLTITEALTNPWKAGENAIQYYGEKLNMSLTELSALFGMTVDEFAAKLDLTTEGLVSKLDITVAEMATSLGLTQEQLAAKLGLTTADLSGKMSMTIQQFATSMGYTIPQLANKLGTTTSGLVENLNMTMTQFAGRLGLTVDQLAGKFGLTTKDLASKLGQTYQQLTNPFGMSMSATVDALKKLEKEYQNILNDIESQSLATISRVNHAMEKNTNKSNNKTSTSTSQKTVTLGSRINAGSAKIYSDSYGGGAGTQYYAKDPIYTIVGENNGYWLVRHHKLSSGYTGWFRKSDVKAYAKGTTGVPKDQWALIDELGDELQLIPDGHGRLSYMKKGTGVVPADLTANLMEWGKLDPSVMLDQNRPQIGVSPSIINNTTEISIDASVGELLHVEHLDGNNPAEITKIVDKAWDKRMKELNSFVRKYSR